MHLYSNSITARAPLACTESRKFSIFAKKTYNNESVGVESVGDRDLLRHALWRLI